MSLPDQINSDIKQAMLAKDRDKLDALRAVKSALLLAATEKGADGTITEEAGLKVLQKLVKQRKDSAEIYVGQGLQDLADVELSQAAIIEAYLPEQMSSDDIEAAVKAIIAQVGASSPADIGKVMGPVMGKLAGKADGKEISAIVKKLLSS